MPFRGHDRFANDVSEVSADRETPIQDHRAERRSCDETPADSKKSAKNPNQKPDHHQIDRADIRVRDREEHGLLGATQEPQQPGRHAFEQHRLADDQKDRHERVQVDVMQVQVLEPSTEKMENEKEINRYEND